MTFAHRRLDPTTRGAVGVILIVLLSVPLALDPALAQSAQAPGGQGGGNGGGDDASSGLDLWNLADNEIENQIAWANGTADLPLYEFDSSANTYVERWVGQPSTGRKKPSASWYAAQIADVDNDGAEELVGFTGALYIFENGSDGTPAYSSGAIGSHWRRFMRVADVDDDGANEVVIHSGDEIYVVECEADGAGVPSCTVMAPSTTGRDTTGLHIADVNGDGSTDVVVGAASVGQNADGFLLVNEGSGFVATQSLADAFPESLGDYTATVGQIVHGDLDGDNSVELVATLTFFHLVDTTVTQGGWGVWSRDANGWVATGFGLIPNAAGDGASGGVGVADFDADGADEFVISVAGGGIWYLDDSGTANEIVPEAAVSDRSTRIGVGDVDNDGALEFVNGTTRGFEIYETSAPGEFFRSFLLYLGSKKDGLHETYGLSVR